MKKQRILLSAVKFRLKKAIFFQMQKFQTECETFTTFNIFLLFPRKFFKAQKKILLTLFSPWKSRAQPHLTLDLRSVEFQILEKFRLRLLQEFRILIFLVKENLLLLEQRFLQMNSLFL